MFIGLRCSINANPLRLAEGRLLVEQLRLQMGNVGSSVIPGILLALLMLWVMTNDANAVAMRWWCLAAIVSKLNYWLYARRHLAAGIALDAAPRLVWVQILLYALDGLAWGGLSWFTLDTAGKAGSILVVSVVAGATAHSLALLSPVLPIFVAFLLCAVGALAWKVWTMGDSAYNALGIATIFYVVTLLGQARNSARATRVGIELRFENIDLLDQLRVKTEMAESAQRKAEHERQVAVRADAAKSKFLAAASHDLRQPIHAQGLFLEVLARTDLSAQQRELLVSACAASDASAEMLNTLLDYSRIDAGVIEPQPQAIPIQPLLNKIEREFEQQADAKGLAYRSRESTLVVYSDPALVELILRNLVSNAIRYTERGGLLVVCRQRGDLAALEVWDTGIGIDVDHQQEVFREFHQLGNPERDRRKGLGLGLAIADGLARALGHRLTLSSSPGRGSVFRLLLPIAHGLPLPEANLAARPGKAEVLKVRVLVVDDDETVRSGMLHLLSEWGCQCDSAESIEEALELARRQAPEVVISDYRLRDQRSGLEAIAALRALVGNSLPALLITGDTGPQRLREAQSSGIPLLHKPVAPSKLYQALVAVLAPEEAAK